jgi:hypothetical protein
MSDKVPINLMQLRRKHFVPTKRTEEYTQRLLRQLGLPDKATVGRLALGRSLADLSDLPRLDESSSEGVGKGIRGDTLFGDDLAIWVALVVEHAAYQGNPNGIDFETIVDLIRRHWDRGMSLLWKDWQESAEGLSKFLEHLSQLASLPSVGSISGSNGARSSDSLAHASTDPIVLRLGEIGVISGTRETAEWTINSSGNAPHLGIFGKSRKGKTRTAKDLMVQVREHGVPLLIIDPKGDLRDPTESAFLRALDANIVCLGREPIPLDVLACGVGNEVRTADGFMEALKGAVPQLGPKQLDTIREITKHLLTTAEVVRFEDIVDAVDTHYKKNDLRGDALTASLHKLRDYSLFEPILSPSEFFKKTQVISVNEVSDESLKFAMLFVLDALLRFLRGGPDAPMDRESGTRALQLMLVIDEARRVMEVASASLINGLVLECGSKGLSCMFISQSPDHMDRASDDIIEQLEVVASFEADVSPKSTKRMFRDGARPRDIQQLELGHLLAKFPGKAEPVVVKAWEP